LRATAAPAARVGRAGAERRDPGEDPAAVRARRGVRPGVRARGGAPDEHHAGPGDARDERLLRGLSAPARRSLGPRAARAGLGLASQLQPLGPAGGARQRRLAQPGGAPQPTPLPRQLASQPFHLRFVGWLPRGKSPATHSVTIRRVKGSTFLLSLSTSRALSAGGPRSASPRRAAPASRKGKGAGRMSAPLG